MVEQKFLELVQYEDHRRLLLSVPAPAGYGGREAGVLPSLELCRRSVKQPRFETRMPALKVQQTEWRTRRRFVVIMQRGANCLRESRTQDGTLAATRLAVNDGHARTQRRSS